METQLETKSNLLKNSELNRFGVISMIILIVGCLGGVTVGIGAINYTFTLILVVLPTMLTLSLLLAVAPMKQILISGLVCLIIDAILITYFAFS